MALSASFSKIRRHSDSPTRWTSASIFVPLGIALAVLMVSPSQISTVTTSLEVLPSMAAYPAIDLEPWLVFRD
jgi:hypothetical protein